MTEQEIIERTKREVASQVKTWLECNGRNYQSDNGWFISWARMGDDLARKITGDK